MLKDRHAGRGNTMSEAEWLAFDDPTPMLEFLRGKVNERKLRLFAVACCRRIWHLMTDERCHRAVEAAERYADGVASEAEWQAAQAGVQEILNAWQTEDEEEKRQAGPWWMGWGYSGYRHRTGAPEKAISAACGAIALTDNGLMGSAGCAAWAAGSDAGYYAEFLDAQYAEQRVQTLLLRDLFGNPFPPASLAPAWLAKDGTIPKLAQAVYEDRDLPSGHLDNHCLAVLADALEDAGCTDPEMLEHCRGPGPHVRGCWVVDLLLGQA
jgi:hypothetical protein